VPLPAASPQSSHSSSIIHIFIVLICLIRSHPPTLRPLANNFNKAIATNTSIIITTTTNLPIPIAAKASGRIINKIIAKTVAGPSNFRIALLFILIITTGSLLSAGLVLPFLRPSIRLLLPPSLPLPPNLAPSPLLLLLLLRNLSSLAPLLLAAVAFAASKLFNSRLPQFGRPINSIICFK
jgi:hypothetical protein